MVPRLAVNNDSLERSNFRDHYFSPCSAVHDTFVL
jgi:hypothetical protein